MRQNVFELILINGTFNAVTVIPSSNATISARIITVNKNYAYFDLLYRIFLYSDVNYIIINVILFIFT